MIFNSKKAIEEYKQLKNIDESQFADNLALEIIKKFIEFQEEQIPCPECKGIHKRRDEKGNLNLPCWKCRRVGIIANVERFLE